MTAAPDSFPMPTFSTPILDGARAEAAIEVVRDIAAALEAPDTSDPSLAGGTSGMALLFACLERRFPGVGYGERAVRLVERSIDLLAAREMSPWLHGGFTGVAWTLAHLDGWLVDATRNEAHETVDRALEDLLARSPWQGPLGLTGGLAGLGLYLLETISRPRARRSLDLVMEHLEMSANRSGPGVSWFFTPERLSPFMRGRFPAGHQDPGMAHGVAGIVGFLARHRRLRPNDSSSENLLHDAVEGLLAQQRHDWPEAFFPYYVVPGAEPVPSGLAWCQGDAGIGVAILAASRSASEPRWEAASLRILRRAAERCFRLPKTTDPGLCHGAAGLGHLFHRVFQATGDEVFREAARTCLDRTLAMRENGSGIAGFSIPRVDPVGRTRQHADGSFLTGAAGVALALLSATSSDELEWDRCLLLSPIEVPPSNTSVGLPAEPTEKSRARESSRARWRPLLEGTEASEALEAAREVARSLPADADHPPDPSLSGGTAGQALFLAYLDRVDLGAGHDRAALALLDRSIESLSLHSTAPSLFGGFPGVAWTVAHLRALLTDQVEDPNREIDEVIRDLLAAWQGEYDLINGLVGLGVYALERLPRDSARESLERIVELLDSRAEKRRDGITWHTPPGSHMARGMERHASGYYNLGVAHGVPGVIGFLGAALEAGTAGATHELLAGAVDWVLAQEVGDDSPVFPCWIAPGLESPPARLAWCYGDAGIAAVLLGAARRAGNPAWERDALRIARGAAARSIERSGVRDAGLCHGAAGLGHLFNRMFQATGDPDLAAAARSWFQRTLEMRHPGRGAGGFSSYTGQESGEPKWRSDPGLLMGASGIALSLLAATSAAEPAWDRVLLCSIAPAESQPRSAGTSEEVRAEARVS